MTVQLSPISHRFTLRALVGLWLAVGCGCGSVDVDPFLDSDRYFTIYGALDMDFLVQHLRVIPIDVSIGAIDETIDAHVTTVDLTTGQSWNWRDSVFTLDNGTIGHVFTSRFRIQAGRTYRTEVERSDGAVTWAETVVPAQPRAVMGEADIDSPPNWTFPGGTQQIVWEGLTTEPYRVDVFYRFTQENDKPFIDFRIPYDTEGSAEEISGGWVVTVSYTKDHKILEEYVQNNPWRLMGVLMRVHILTGDWEPPGGVWDPEILSQPGTFSNVHNGFGYVGSSGRFSVEWIP